MNVEFFILNRGGKRKPEGGSVFAEKLRRDKPAGILRRQGYGGQGRRAGDCHALPFPFAPDIAAQCPYHWNGRWAAEGTDNQKPRHQGFSGLCSFVTLLCSQPGRRPRDWHALPFPFAPDIAAHTRVCRPYHWNGRRVRRTSPYLFSGGGAAPPYHLFFVSSVPFCSRNSRSFV